MNIRPIRDRIVARRIKPHEQTRGGLYIPDSAREKSMEAEVIAVGNGKVLDSGAVHQLEVKPGDRVLIETYAGQEVKLDGEERLLLRESEILAVIDK